MKQVILFGGTFDPPHLGHLLMAELAHEQMVADEVWWLPAPVPPHKPEDAYVPYAHRVAMTEALIASVPYFRVSTLEQDLPKPSYTVDTIAACQRMFPNCKFYFLIGSDSLAQLPTWHQAERLTQEVSFLVSARAGYPFTQTYNEICQQLPELSAVQLIMPVLDISSTWIRQRLSEGKSVCELTPRRVLDLYLNSIRADSQ